MVRVAELVGLVLCAAIACVADEPLVVLQVAPAREMSVSLYDVKVGTKGVMAFDLPVALKEVREAFLEMYVDDIDEPKEATVCLNGNPPLTLHPDMLGEGRGHHGKMEVPVAQLRAGRNEFTFAFVDDLGGTTKGYVIEGAQLLLRVPRAVAEREATKKGVSIMGRTSPVDILEHRVPTPPPVGTRKLDVGFEIAAPLGFGGFVHHKDGRLMMIEGGRVCYSSDGGRTWTQPEKFPVGIEEAVRLQSGKLGGRAGMTFYISEDEGKTWVQQGNMSVGGWPGGPYYDVLLQTKTGRILFPVRCTAAGHNGHYEQDRAWGTIAGERKPVEGHAQWPEMDITFVYYSDDEGKTWRRSEGEVVIWHNDGFGGMWPCDEPNIIELKNGDVMLYLRTSLGRIYAARSGPCEYKDDQGNVVKLSPGVRFDYPQPTDLASSYSPCRIRRIPKTGDLLLFWNQVSGDEIRAGYRRGRICTAISKDDGKTWQHFRTIDRIVLPPAGKVKPDPEPGVTRALKYVGELPDDFGHVDYPNFTFDGDNVLLLWIRSVVKPRPADITGFRIRVLPLSWFYQDDPPYKPPKPTPKLVIAQKDKEGSTVPSLYCDERFFVKLSDVARVLRRTVKQDSRAPVHQALTCLGYRVTYDLRHQKDPKNPRVLAIVEPEKASRPTRGRGHS